jgi:hypothetical protein
MQIILVNINISNDNKTIIYKGLVYIWKWRLLSLKSKRQVKKVPVYLTNKIKRIKKPFIFYNKFEW